MPDVPTAAAHRTDAPAAAPGQATLWVLLSGTFVTVLDFFIVAVAVPSIEADLGASPPQLQWVVAAYGLAFATLLIPCGRLGDQFGRRRLYGLGLLVFVAASVGCGLAPDAGTLIAARALQGVGSAMIAPQVLGMLTTLYGGAARARAFATYGLVLGLAATFGQLIGGLLIAWNPAALGWRACFLINPLLAAPALLSMRRVLPTSPRAATRRFDVVGILLLGVGLAGLVWALIEGRDRGDAALATAVAAGSVGLLATFVAWQRRLAALGGAPLVPMTLLAQPRFLLALAAAGLFYMTNASLYFVVALYSQHGRGLDALGAAWLFTTLAGGFFIASRIGARHPAAGPRSVEAGALLLAAAHAAGWALLRDASTRVPLGWLVPLLVAQGAAIGLIMAPLTALALAGAPARDAGVAAGAFATFQWLGNSLGIAAVGLPFYAALQAARDADGVLPPVAWQQATGAALGLLALLAITFWWGVRRLRRGEPG